VAPECAPPATPAAEHPAGTLNVGEWKSWSPAQKLAYMKSTVLPDEKPLWAKYDPKRFSEMSCNACHGASGEARGWKMPNPDLPKLEPGGIMELYNTHREAYMFMAGTVVPHTARLLGLPNWDHGSHTGFGCFGCHTAKR
jgi:hypothetical protein